MNELTDTEKRILDFEAAGQHWRFGGSKAALIRENFDWSETRYFQVLEALIDRPEAWAYDVVTVKRLRRFRDARRAVRSGGRLRVG